MERFSLQPKRRLAVVIGLIISIVVQFLPLTAQAAGFGTAIIRLDRMAASTATSVLVCAQPASTATEASVKVTFPASFSLGTAATLTTSVLTTGANPIPTTINSTSVSAWPTLSSAATNVTGQVATFTNGDMTVGTLYCFEITGGVTTGAAGSGTSYQATVATYASGAVLIDQTNVGLAVVTSDQITVTAVVPPSFQFSLSGNTDSFASALSYSSVNATTGIAATVQTNAKGGWVAWAKDSQQGLHSATANYTIPAVSTSSATTLTAGTEQFGAYASAVTQPTNTGHCTVAMTSPWSTTTTTAVGYGSTFAQVAACTGGTSGTANSSGFTLIEAANIASSTPAAADYSDIITVVGAGLF